LCWRNLKNKKEIIITVIKNFVCDAVKGIWDPTQDLIDNSIDRAVKDFMDDMIRVASRLLAVMFALAQPIPRPIYDWYMERHGGLGRALVNGINAMNMENISKLDKLSHKSQSFAEDGIGQSSLTCFFIMRTGSSTLTKST
jgi:hypothetical protein